MRIGELGTQRLLKGNGYRIDTLLTETGNSNIPKMFISNKYIYFNSIYIKYSYKLRYWTKNDTF